jgi:hypothetical protein
MFEVDKYDANSNAIGWTKGGFQGARGADHGAEWFVEVNFYFFASDFDFQ